MITLHVAWWWGTVVLMILGCGMMTTAKWSDGVVTLPSMRFWTGLAFFMMAIGIILERT